MPTAKKPEAEPRVLPLGSRVGISEGKEVVRPDGMTVRVTGGQYVLDIPGVHECDGESVTAE